MFTSNKIYAPFSAVNSSICVAWFEIIETMHFHILFLAPCHSAFDFGKYIITDILIFGWHLLNLFELRPVKNSMRKLYLKLVLSFLFVPQSLWYSIVFWNVGVLNLSQLSEAKWEYDMLSLILFVFLFYVSSEVLNLYAPLYTVMLFLNKVPCDYGTE